MTSQTAITVEGNQRVIRSNGIPDHEPGRFPARGNPNTISPQSYHFTVPLHPQAADKTTPLVMQPFGVAVNGVVLDPLAAEWWQGDSRSGWQYEALSGRINLGTDASNAHVQPNGAYHYHGIPHGLVKKLAGGKPAMVLIGWAADGFPIYGPHGHARADDATSELRVMKPGYQIKSGERNGGPGGKHDGTFVADYEFVSGLGDLDECNGRFGPTPEFPKGIYHYHVTEAFPFIPRLFRGTPDPSFARRRGPPPGRGDPMNRPGQGRRGGPGFGGGEFFLPPPWEKL